MGRWYTVARAAVLAMAVSLFVALSAVQIDGNIISDRYASTFASNVRTIFPQGWNFFTKPPTDAFGMMYEVGQGDELTLRTHETSSPEAMFGLNRNMRSLGIEMGHVAAQVNENDAWSECEQRSEECLAFDRGGASFATNPVEGAEFCGEYVMTEAIVTPRAYRDLVGERYTVERYISLEIECESA